MEFNFLDPAGVFEGIFAVSPEQVIALAVCASSLLGVQLHSCKDPWHLGLAAIWCLHRAVVSTVWEWVTGVILSADICTELNEGRDAIIRH